MGNSLKPSIPYGRQQITDEDIAAVTETLRADFLTQGPKIAEFEKAFADYVGAKYAIAVSNGTAALHLAALALGVENTSRVLTTPITFAASANCVAYCGGRAEFVDINPTTGLIDLVLLEQRLKDAPVGAYSGVIPVDFAGAVVNLEQLRALADEYGLWIINDACHAPGGYFVDSNKQKQSCGNGNFSDCSIFSFHPVKHIACGEGGMVTTNREDLYEKLLLLRTHGITKDPTLLIENHGGWYYEMQDLGYNYRLTDIQAALGLSQLSRADIGLARRRQIAKFYDQAFENSVIQPLGLNIREGHAFHLYVVLVPRRKELYDHLRDSGIYSQVHYIPVHLLPYYHGLGHRVGDCPHAESYYERCLSIPIYPTLTDDEAQYVVDRILDFYNN